MNAGSAITSISLMNGVAALAALGFGPFAFGESLGASPTVVSASPTVVSAHMLALGLVLASVPTRFAAASWMTRARPNKARPVGPPARPTVLAVGRT
jgi:hypothetical protein